MIGGGVASVSEKRLLTACKKYLDEFNPSREHTYGVLVEAKNVYGGIMENFPLQLKDF